jgi:hypothetical protein
VLLAGDVSSWHFSDIATGPDDVGFQGKTGSSRPTTKMTQLTLLRHQPRRNLGTAFAKGICCARNRRNGAAYMARDRFFIVVSLVWLVTLVGAALFAILA